MNGVEPPAFTVLQLLQFNWSVELRGHPTLYNAALLNFIFIILQVTFLLDIAECPRCHSPAFMDEYSSNL